MINEAKLSSINEALSRWAGASMNLNRFHDSMSNALTLCLYKDSKRAALELCACQYMQIYYSQENVDLFCDKTTYEGFECFSLKDRNSKFEVIVGSSIHLGNKLIATVDE